MRRVSPVSRPTFLRFMRTSVAMGVVALPALNAPSTAVAADRCLRFSTESRPPRALVVARPGVDLERAVERGTQDAHGPVVLRPSSGSCALTFVVAPPA